MILGMICERFRLFFKCYESSECVDLLSLSVILVYFVSNFAFVLVFVHMFMCFVCFREPAGVFLFAHESCACQKPGWAILSVNLRATSPNTSSILTRHLMLRIGPSP